MSDPFKDLYDRIAGRKDESLQVHPYVGGNGRIDRAVQIILSSELPRSGVLMDVGGANGNLGYSLREHFETRVVVDISEASCGAARQKGNSTSCRNVDTDGLPGEQDGWVDLIVALDFIEHILDPEKFAAECMRILRPGGAVLINTPNIQYWRHLESLVTKGIFPHTSGDNEVYHGGHTAFFTVDDMHRIFGSFIERLQRIEGLVADPPPPLWLNLLTNPPSQIARTWRLAYPDLVFSCRKPG